MKFTKEDAYKELVSKIPNKGQTLNLTERSINETLDTLMPLIANDETELNDFITKVLPIFKVNDGGVRHKVSEEIKKYQEEHPSVEQTKPSPTQVKKDDDDPSTALLKRIEELEKKNADNEKKSTISKRRSDIISKMGEKGCKDKEWINELLEEVNLDGEEFDVDFRVEKYIKMYNKSQAKVQKNVTPITPSGSGVDSYLSEVIKSAAEKSKAQ